LEEPVRSFHLCERFLEFNDQATDFRFLAVLVERNFDATLSSPAWKGFKM